MVTIPVPVERGAHEYHVQAGLIGGIGQLVKKVMGSLPLVIVADKNVAASAARSAAASLAEEKLPVIGMVPVQAEERNKTLEGAGALYDAFLEHGLDRGGAVVVVGGGLVGDLAGFAAATYKRGVPFVLCPTTLLSMVDASIGGKTAINRRLPGGGLGKNLIGTVTQPLAIVADPAVLSTLPDRELRCGLAESVKHAVVGDAGLMDLLERDGEAILARDPEALQQLIERSVPVKIRLVAEDPREHGRRAELNLGHTFAHAAEAEESLGLRHGEAVSVGLVAAARLAAARRMLPAGDADRIERLLARLGLPTRLPGRPERGRLLRMMSQDKKVLAGRMRLILPRAIGRVEIIEDAQPEEVDRAWCAVGAV
jgi:3-dehydroquinate synthase